MVQITLRRFSWQHTRQVVEEIDDALAYFMREIRRSPVFENTNFIFTSDHGMVELDPDKYFNVYSHDKVFQNLNDHLIISHILGIDPAPPNDCTWADIEGLFVTE